MFTNNYIESYPNIFNNQQNNNYTDVFNCQNNQQYNKSINQHFREDTVSFPYMTPDQFDKPNLLHKNVPDKVILDTLIEYTLVIDSIDRDIEKFPNPFNYKVYFNPVSKTKDAYIYRTFKNVKYIKLETAILPRKYYYTRNIITESFNTDDINLLTSNIKESNTIIDITTTDLSGSYAIIEDYTENNNRIVKFCQTKAHPEVIDKIYELIKNDDIIIYEYKLQNYSLSDEKYLLMYIDEFNDINDLATNTEVSNSFSILFPDFVNGDFYYTDTHYVDKIFKFSSLGNINSFTIRIGDSTGKLYKTQQNNSFMDSHINKYNKCSCTTDSDGNFIRDYRCCCTYIRHPFYKKFQNTLLFKIGVVETDIDKAIFN